MIQRTSVLGISLASRTRRRGLVAGYYLVLLLIVGVGLWKQKFIGYAFVVQTLTLGGFFGGIRSESLIKPYSDAVREPGESPIQGLGLAPARCFGSRPLLDEREVHERDHAHYTAYRILRFSLLFVGVAFVVCMMYAPEFVANNSLDLLWGFIVFVLSLPQSVILWTEPEPMPDAELGLIATSR